MFLLDRTYLYAFFTADTYTSVYSRIQKAFLILDHSDRGTRAYGITSRTSAAILFSVEQYRYFSFHNSISPHRFAQVIIQRIQKRSISRVSDYLVPPEKIFLIAFLIFLFNRRETGVFVGLAYFFAISEKGMRDRSRKKASLISGLSAERYSDGLDRTPSS